MSQNTDKLIKMANQIGDFFDANPNDEEAKKDIANHLHKFWNSVMINAITEHVKVDGVSHLKPRVAEAIKQHLLH